MSVESVLLDDHYMCLSVAACNLQMSYAGVLPGLGGSPLGRFCGVYLGSPFNNAVTNSSLANVRQAGVSESQLFPSPPPFRDALSPPPKRGPSKAQFQRLCARHYVNLLFGHLSFLELGCQKVAWNT